MWRLALGMIKTFINCLLIVYLFFLSPLDILAAEVLQVQSSSTIRLGDRNRNYTVRLSCLEIDDDKEAESIAWLKKELPRGKKVNLRPQGSKEGVLLAKITPLNSDDELSKQMVNLGFAKAIC